MSPTDAVYLTSDLAKRFGLSPRQVLRYVRKGVVPGARNVMGRWVFNRATIDAWLAPENRPGATERFNTYLNTPKHMDLDIRLRLLRDSMVLHSAANPSADD